MRKRICAVLTTAAVFGAVAGATGFASPSVAAGNGCSVRAEGSTGASALCKNIGAGSQAVVVSCRRAANGVSYTVRGPYVKKNKRSYAYCASGDARTGYRTNAGDIILS